jgi:hypothetical protein
MVIGSFSGCLALTKVPSANLKLSVNIFAAGTVIPGEDAPLGGNTNPADKKRSKRGTLSPMFHPLLNVVPFCERIETIGKRRAFER